jgi:hypothetical protein
MATRRPKRRKTSRSRASAGHISLQPIASGPGEPSTASEGTTPFATAAPLSKMRVLTILSNTVGPLIPAAEFPIRTVVADDTYLETPPEFVVDAIRTDPVLSPASYQANIFDCDDYVQYLKTKLSLYAATNHLPAPLAVGYLCTNDHAFTVCIGPNTQLFLINTQSDDHLFTGDPATFRQFLSLRPGNGIIFVYM